MGGGYGERAEDLWGVMRLWPMVDLEEAEDAAKMPTKHGFGPDRGEERGTGVQPVSPREASVERAELHPHGLQPLCCQIIVVSTVRDRE